MRLASSLAAPCGPQFESFEGESSVLPAQGTGVGLSRLCRHGVFAKLVGIARTLCCLTLCVGVSGLLPNQAEAKGKKGKGARDKIIELNKKALESYAAKDYESALDFLATAIKEAREAGLGEDKLTARTYLHLGAVYWTGFGDQSMAVQSFTQAKRLRPDIQLTTALETPELRTIFELATVEADESPPAQK